MLKKKRTFISKILLASMCVSIVPATVALAEENAVIQENVSNDIEVIPMFGEPQATTSLALKSNASTGYSWKYTVVQGDSIVESSKSYMPDDTSGTIDGSGGTDIWIFKSLKEGSTTLRFEYSRSWEKDEVETKEFVITVDSKMNTTVKETTKGTAQIQLKANPTTGCSWRYSVVQGESIEEASTLYVTDAVPADIDGSGGTDIWVFKGLKEGSTLLKFEYLQSWLENAFYTKYFNLAVDKDLNVTITEVAEPPKDGPSSQINYDINGDSKVSLIDLVLLKKYLLDNTVVINKDAADINRDGQINAIDVALLRKVLLT